MLVLDGCMEVYVANAVSSHSRLSLTVSELSIVSRKVGTLETGPILLKGERKYVVSCKVTTKELDFKPETL